MQPDFDELKQCMWKSKQLQLDRKVCCIYQMEKTGRRIYCIVKAFHTIVNLQQITWWMIRYFSLLNFCMKLWKWHFLVSAPLRFPTIPKGQQLQLHCKTLVCFRKAPSTIYSDLIWWKMDKLIINVTETESTILCTQQAQSMPWLCQEEMENICYAAAVLAFI